MISTIVHTAVLATLAVYRFTIMDTAFSVPVETVVAEQPAEPQIEQELTIDTTAGEYLSTEAGGLVSTGIGGGGGGGEGGPSVAMLQVESSGGAGAAGGGRVFTIGDINISHGMSLGMDLGEREVSGEVGARVSGYGAAMSRMTAELIRMMRRQPVLVVWLFDASNSLRDDRAEISTNFHKIYDELRIAQDEAKVRNVKYSPLETMVCSFGQDLKKLLPEPTHDIPKIKAAIGAVENDESGVEKTFASIGHIVEEYSSITARTGRKLAIVVVTDESGNDDDVLDEVITRTTRSNTPVYFMGREAIFGYPTANMHWQDPKTKLDYWVPVDRGPETAFPECLQYDGLHERWDNASSGFGPYGQVRLAKQSGGIFFLLASHEEDLTGLEEWGPRRYSDLSMKEYEPQLIPRREYEQNRNASEFRNTIWQVIVSINPNLDQELRLQQDHFSIVHSKFLKQKDEQFGRCLRALAILNEGIRRLEKVKSLREKERERRWRAAYDLCYAQLLSYRVRQFQYLLLLDQHAQQNPKPENGISNEWFMHNTQELLPPTPEQVKATRVNLDELEKQRTLAMSLFDFVIAEHPGTPWARRAELEKGWGFGYKFGEVFWDPRQYDYSKVPKF